MWEDQIDGINTYEVEDDIKLQEQQLVTIKTKAPRPKSQHIKSVSTNDAKFDVTGMTTEEISDKINSMYQKLDGVWICLQCGKTSYNSSRDMRLHVETHIVTLVTYAARSSGPKFL